MQCCKRIFLLNQPDCVTPFCARKELEFSCFFNRFEHSVGVKLFKLFKKNIYLQFAYIPKFHLHQIQLKITENQKSFISVHWCEAFQNGSF